MKTGVKCEIHSCTIEFARNFLKQYFNEDDFEFLEDSLKTRKDTQYYVDRNISDDFYKKMLEQALIFFCKV